MLLLRDPSRMMPSISASSFGATGNGSTDDTAALNAAFAAAVGKRLYIGPGTYMISDWLLYPSNARITGAGDGVTTIKNTTGRDPASTYMILPSGFGADDITDVIFEGITFDQRADFYGDSHDQITFSVDGTNNVTVQYCGFRNVRTIALWCDSYPAQPCTGHQAFRNHVYDSNGGGFSYFGELTGFRIIGNTIEDTQDDAIAVQDTGPGTSNGAPSSGLIADNIILNCDTQNSFTATPRGILVYGGHHIDVLRNSATNTFASNFMACEGVARRAHDIVFGENTGVGAGHNNSTTGLGTTTPAYGVFLANADTITVRNTDISGGLHGDAEYFYTGCTGVTESGNT